MNFSKIQLTPMNKQLTVHTIQHNKMNKINFTMCGKTPFGIEEYNSQKYVNWEIEDDMVELLLIVEQNFAQELNTNYDMYKSWSLKSAIKGKEEYTKLLRTKVKNNVEIQPHISYSVTIILDSIWLHKKDKTFGIMWHTTSI